MKPILALKRGSRKARRGVPLIYRAVGIILTAFTAANETSAIEPANWEQSPYRIQVTLAVDSSARPGLVNAENLAAEIVERAEASFGVLWQLELQLASAVERFELLAEISEPQWDDLSSEQRQFDKLFWLTARTTSHGLSLQCREYDAYTRRSSALLQQQSHQPRMLGETCFQLLKRTFSPLAVIRPMEDEAELVHLTFRGSALPRPAEAVMAEAGTVFLPLLRRTNRSGELLAGGVMPLPWTYLELLEAPPETARVESGIRRPFGIRRRGFVEQLAIALPQASRSTTVRLHARHDPQQSLAGYEVFLGRDDQSPASLGRTDAQGRIEIPADLGPIATLYVKSDGQLLIKAPVPVGAVSRVDLPLADDPARLRAQALAQSIRERLVDLVARRKIMAARIRDLLAKGKISDAQRMMSELNSLPGPSEFNLEISAALRDNASQSSDARVQQRIDQMYAEIQSLLSRFLNRQPLTVLQSEVDAAASQGK